MNYPSQVRGPVERLGLEVSKFLVVGAVATLVALVLFNLLVHGFGAWDAPMNQQPVLAYVVANLIGMVVSFYGVRDWAFSARGVRHADGGRTAFVVINLATMLIPIGFLWFSRNVLGLDDPASDNIAANVLGLFVANAVRFGLFRQYVFPNPQRVARSHRR